MSVALMIGLLIPLEALSLWIDRRAVVVGQCEPFPCRTVAWGTLRCGERWLLIRLPFVASYREDFFRDRLCWHTAMLVWRESRGWRLSWEPARD